MNRALSLNYFRKTNKGISLPLVASEKLNVGGCYYHPYKGECLVGNQYYSLDNGLIVLPPDSDDGVLSHEWRHHWQYMNGYNLQNTDILWHSLKGSYKEKIIKYFLGDKSEMDALIFSLPFSKGIDQEWYEWIRDYIDLRGMYEN